MDDPPPSDIASRVLHSTHKALGNGLVLMNCRSRGGVRAEADRSLIVLDTQMTAALIAIKSQNIQSVL